MSNKNLDDKNYLKRFENGFKILTYSRSPYEVWSDIIEIFAITIQNSCTRHYNENDKLKSVWQNRENQYLRTIKKYSPKEQKVIVQMFSLLVMEYSERPYQDLLGKLYMTLGISNNNAGQFFTPYNVCQLMSDVSFNKKEVAKKIHTIGYIGVNDPSCGAGATLISFAEKCSESFKKLDYKNHVYFVGQDIDLKCVQMCYIQLSLLGLAGYVIWADTLTTPKVDFFKDNEKIWLTPNYNMNIWQGRIMAHNLGMLMESPVKSNKA